LVYVEDEGALPAGVGDRHAGCQRARCHPEMNTLKFAQAGLAYHLAASGELERRAATICSRAGP
jgi:hypothetical protein